MRIQNIMPYTSNRQSNPKKSQDPSFGKILSVKYTCQFDVNDELSKKAAKAFFDSKHLKEFFDKHDATVEFTSYNTIPEKRNFFNILFGEEEYYCTQLIINFKYKSKSCMYTEPFKHYKMIEVQEDFIRSITNLNTDKIYEESRYVC